MRRMLLVLLGAAAFMAVGLAQGSSSGPYKVIKTDKVGGPGGWDYVYADVNGRRLYIDRGAGEAPDATPARITVYNLDTLAHIGDIPNTGGHGVAVDPKTHHGFSSSNPVTMFDTKTLKVIKTITTKGNPDGIMFDPYNERIHVFSHRAPNDTVIDAKDGSIVGTIDLGGAPEQAQSDDAGHLYVDLEDKAAVAVVDASTLKVTAKYDVSSKGQGLSGLGLDNKHHLLFVTCHEGAGEGQPPVMVVLNTEGKILDALPIGKGTDGGGFNANTMEAFSSGGQAGTLSVIKENNPTSFSVEEDLPTAEGARTMTIDTKTNHVFVITAKIKPASTTAAAQGQRRRRELVPGSFEILEIGR